MAETSEFQEHVVGEARQAETMTLGERPLMMSDNFQRFLTYIPTLFLPYNIQFFGSF